MRFSAFAVLLAVSTAAGAAPELTTGPIKMKPSEIKAYNASLTKEHPNYIRCRRERETGSLVKGKMTCRTNQEWARIEGIGNDSAREAVEGLQKGWSNGQN
ncbi:hypothetical protein [Novosphingobium sp. TH158]|uniref:hypothetical protein n=1 Tax=Novosphingobium sp. TH158 TaxID=2067455 RepID=UPI000C7BAACF|nr:hypothetical protein [Novosphingobium sp. TH158]PLK27270.1 hypothetical protein C0V78_10500 [Novosphingobium sp. TH158]